MERLTVKWKPKLYDVFDPIDVADNEYSKINFEKLLTKLGEYEDAEEQGLLHRAQIPDGTTIYIPIEKSLIHGFVFEAKYRYGVSEDRWGESGKGFFLTHEEAEAALAEKGGVE